MIRTPAQRRRRVAARLLPLLVALGALPLMAPTCGSPAEGSKIFARGSLIIPMDVCYQYQTDDDRSSYTATGCPQAVDAGDVIRAYGLVYELIRSGIPVYWVIENTKSAVDGVDLTLQYNGGVPVLGYDWANDRGYGAPTAAHTISYRGGPFVVDGSDAARARAVMQQVRGTFQNVNVHVANVAFKGYAKRTMAGGWSAGGATAPKLALLSIGSSGSGTKNSEVVIRGYLTRAGLDTAGAAGTATGIHGEIYDNLDMLDFIPTVAGGGWERTRLHQNGYQILWVPHWTAPSSCEDCPASGACPCLDKYDPVTISSALKTIGAFVANGGDLFAECAGLGSFEGVFRYASPNTSDYSQTYVVNPAAGPEDTTTFQTEPKTGVWIEVNTPSGAYLRGQFNSPFMQLGDYPFLPHSGAISDYRPNVYDPSPADSTVRLISETSTGSWDLFTLRPHTPGSGTRGTIVYLGGHSYSGSDGNGNFSIGGSRLVLNTLFNLGAGCTADGVACNTGLYGVCATGHYHCTTQAGPPECVPDIQPDPTRAEICNGLDDNCNGEIDEGLTNNDCFDPPAGWVDPITTRTPVQLHASRNTGVCRAGVSSCVQKPDGSWGMSACVGQVLPVHETCNGLDDDCDGTIDGASLTTTCYSGAAGTENVGECRGGSQFCFDGAWGATTTPSLSSFQPGLCKDEVLARPEECGTGRDENCNGQIDEGCTCVDGTYQACFTGPGTAGQGICMAGRRRCTGGVWDPECDSTNADVLNPERCTLPAKPAPDPGYLATWDTNCDGKTTQCSECDDGQTRSCWGPGFDPAHVPTIAGRGQCTWGTQTCLNGTYGPCAGYGRQSVAATGSPVEYCDDLDNNCNGPRAASPDYDGVHGVPADPNPLLPATATRSTYVDEDAICPPHYTCLNAVCVPDYCGVEQPAPEGYTCHPGAHYLDQSTCGGATCGAGQLCQYSSCIDPCPVSSTQLDPETLRSASLVCGSGTSCGGGACIGGGCYEAGCQVQALPLCRAGSCVADPCAGVTCPSGTFCRDGLCVQACVFVSCSQGQRCGLDGFCVADPCAGVTCGADQRCANGACVANPCVGTGCAVGQYCDRDPTTGSAVCMDDPCTGIECPAGVCVQGQCYSSGNRSGVGSASRTSSSKSGCGCGSGTEAAWPALLGLLLAPLRRRRAGAGRGGGIALALVAAAALATAPGCKKSSTTDDIDLSACAATCGEQRCVDVASDPGHCGNCTHTCGSGEQCGDGVCGPSGLVAPYVQSLSPASGDKDAPAVVVTVTGARFRDGATVRLTTSLGPRTLTCSADGSGGCRWFESGTTLEATLDLTGAAETTPENPWTLRVVNPDLVISNAVSFGVSVPTPSVSPPVSPDTLAAGTAGTITVQGTGFTSLSKCVLWSQSLGYLPPIAGTLGPAGLACFVDASTLAGSYRVYVLSEKQVMSQNYADLTISPSDPVVFSVSPDHATTVAPVTLTVLGDRFDSQTDVLFDGTAVQTTVYFSSSQLAASKVSLTYVTAGIHAISVLRRSTGKVSNPVAFSVGSPPPAVLGLTPPIAYQGDVAVPLALSGTNLPSDAIIEVEPPGTTTFSTAFASGTAVNAAGTMASATYSLVRANDTSAPSGIYNVRLRYPSSQNAASAPLPLRVISNQAILRDYDAWPTPNQAGPVGTTKTQLDFDVSNVRPGTLTIVFDSVPATSAAHREFPPDSVTTLVRAYNFALGGLDAGTYTFTVRNPHHATPSNALTFAVTPGTPTLTKVCVDGTDCTRQVTQQDAPVTFRLTGTNFARRDVNGNGSTVMYASPPPVSPNWPAPDPCGVVTTTGTQFQPVTVTSMSVPDSHTILIQVDTRAAYVDQAAGGTTYYLGVWNPGGASAPFKSSCGVDPSTLPSIRITP